MLHRCMKLEKKGITGLLQYTVPGYIFRVLSTAVCTVMEQSYFVLDVFK